MNFKKLIEEAIDNDPDMREKPGMHGPARRVAKVVILRPDGSFASEVKLDTSCYDNIGWTKKSLAEFVQNTFINDSGKHWYVASDKVMRDRGQRSR